jgi:type IV pilus assembly protein PilO
MTLSTGFKGIGNKLSRMSKGQKLFIVIGLNIIIFVFLYFFLINPLIDTKKKLTNDYQLVKKDLDKLVDIKNNMEKYRKEYAQMQEVLGDILRQLPESKDIPNLLRNVSAIGTETRVKVTYFEPGVVQNKDFYGEFPFKFKFAGPFHNIGYFFDGIRKMERVIDIRNFTLVAKGTPPRIVLEGDGSAKSYVYLKEQPKPQPKDEKKDVKSGPPPKK